ncbi:MAG: glutamine-hydrolyzing carbamoyl-phosphate synthase small subunit [Deltaproteobacteria bacterium]|jgi:carbamoyl-phosphate synthase small subunit|nr:glutamine-hydrolyzing carbamoyl-phosphate synthase small subunit [Deltaproteobacteria bacterium]
MKGYLVLESNEVFQGELSFPEEKSEKEFYSFERAGEVVFNTSHFGYEEIATDPSYFSQIVVLTAPQQGNYGISKEVWESRRIWIEGFVALDVQDSVRDHSWRKQLQEHHVPVLSGLDTRFITLRLREKGTPWGAIVVANSKEQALKKAHVLISQKKMNPKDWVFEVSRKETELRRGEIPFGPKLAVLDFGVKENIIKLLCRYSKEVAIFNSRTSYENLQAYMPDALMLTNGPGDPAEVQIVVDVVKRFLGKIPVFGICMGHQILALAIGARTYKLKFGHRGSNHPIDDKLLNQIYVSSQNHGYAVDKESLPKNVQVTQINLNDNTVAGFYSQDRNFLGIQYHPEACPGPHEAMNLFKFFFEKMFLQGSQKAKDQL